MKLVGLIFSVFLVGSVEADSCQRLPFPWHHCEPMPIPRLYEGVYASEGAEDHLVKGQISLSRWASDYFVEGQIVDGSSSHPFSLQLFRHSGNVFEGEGKVIVSHKSGMQCRYPMHLLIYSYVEKMYLKDFSPTEYPKDLNADGSCKPAGRGQWTIHRNPFYRR